MGKQSRLRLSSVDPDFPEDLKQLIRIVRARQNSLLTFLECVTQCQTKIRSVEDISNTNSFVKKQKQFTGQIASILQKYQSLVLLNLASLSKVFWLKLRAILKASQQRIFQLGFLNDQLKSRFRQMLDLTNCNAQKIPSLEDYKRIESLIKKRTIEALVAGKSSLRDNRLISKNRSENLLKSQESSVPASPFKLHFRDEIGNVEQQLSRNLKSLSRHGAKRSHMQKLKKSKVSDSFQRNFDANVDRYERNFGKLLTAHVDCRLDSKKTVFENVFDMYECLFERNIQNHKAIAKHVFKGSRMVRLFHQFSRKGRPVEERHIKKRQIDKLDMLPSHKILLNITKQKCVRSKTQKQRKSGLKAQKGRQF